MTRTFIALIALLALGCGGVETVSLDPDSGPGGDGSADPDAATNPGPPIAQIVGGNTHTCALTRDGRVRCWGANGSGQLGIGIAQSIGDDEPASASPFLELGGRAVSLGAGGANTCAILEGGGLRCWGAATAGQTENIGDDELPLAVAPIDVGGPVAEVCGGDSTLCARLESGEVRCWGTSNIGLLGVPGVTTIDAPASFAAINLGGPAIDIECGVGNAHCAVLEGGAVQCWGFNPPSGHPGNTIVGDDESPGSVGVLGLSSPATVVAVGHESACALSAAGAVTCWGRDPLTGYGLGTTTVIGDDEAAGSRGTVSVGEPAIDIVSGHNQTCVILESGDARCWGDLSGHLAETVGDDELPSQLAPLPFPADVHVIGVGYDHTCAALVTGDVYCWGPGLSGRLGHGNEDSILTDVANPGPVPLLLPGELD